MNKLLFIVSALIVVVLPCCDNTSKSLEANKNLINQFTEATNAQDYQTILFIICHQYPLRI